MLRRSFPAAIFLAAVVSASIAQAHFLWIVTHSDDAEGHGKASLYFSERAEPDDPALLDRVSSANVWAVGSGRIKDQPLKLRPADDSLDARLPLNRNSAVVAASLKYGVISRGGDTFLLEYYAKAQPGPLPGTWSAVDNKEELPLEIVPELSEGAIVVRVFYKGRAVADAPVTVDGPGLDEAIEGTTDAEGAFRFEIANNGLYSIRSKQVEEASGEHDGKKYDSIRRYVTLTLPVERPRMTPVAGKWPELPQGVTSFGGAIIGNHIYVYGGHYGEAHHYSQEGQSGDFMRLNLDGGEEWESLPGGPKLTGLAMVAYKNKLYRVGGFTANNTDGEEEELESRSEFARFDPAKGEWESLPGLPEGRSSFDAAILGDTLYVVGGWTLTPGEDAKWLNTALAVDLSAEKLEWKEITPPPFQRRAVALAVWQGKLYCIGGMKEQGGPTREVAVYDPARKEWSEGPAIHGEAMDGFGASAFATQDGLYVTTMSGSIQQLSADGSKWEFVGQMNEPRFFHRLLPWGDHKLVAIAGASMSVGKFGSLELLTTQANVASR